MPYQHAIVSTIVISEFGQYALLAVVITIRSSVRFSMPYSVW